VHSLRVRPGGCLKSSRTVTDEPSVDHGVVEESTCLSSLTNITLTRVVDHLVTWTSLVLDWVVDFLEEIVAFVAIL